MNDLKILTDQKFGHISLNKLCTKLALTHMHDIVFANSLVSFTLSPDIPSAVPILTVHIPSELSYATEVLHN